MRSLLVSRYIDTASEEPKSRKSITFNIICTCRYVFDLTSVRSGRIARTMILLSLLLTEQSEGFPKLRCNAISTVKLQTSRGVTLTDAHVSFTSSLCCICVSPGLSYAARLDDTLLLRICWRCRCSEVGMYSKRYDDRSSIQGERKE